MEFIPKWCLHFPTGTFLQLTHKNANNRICQVLIMDTVKITTLNPPKKCVSAYGVNIVGSHGGEMQASLTPVVY